MESFYRCVCLSVSPFHSLNQITDLYETWYDRHVFGRHPSA
jgi:hypothetical protein